MKEALFWRPFHDNTIQCRLCPHVCKIDMDAIGKCGARQNIDGKLISLVYGKAISIHDLAEFSIHHLPNKYATK